MALTPDGTQLYVLNSGSNNISVVSTATGSVASTIAVGQAPHGRSIFMGPSPSVLAASVLPGGRSVEEGKPATIFASILNTSDAPVENCQIDFPLNTIFTVSLDYQTTNPMTNAINGKLNTPASIPPHGLQTYILAFSATSGISLLDQPLNFFCDGIQPAPVVVGVNTVDLTVSTTPVPDIVALAATVTNDGTVHVPNGSSAAFGVATVNLGSSEILSVEADTGTASLPVSISLCQSNPATGACLAPPTGGGLSFSPASNSTATFSIFVKANDVVPFAPGTSRVFVNFSDATGPHGSTSVAVTTD